MENLFKRIIKLLLAAFVLVAFLGLWKAEELKRLLAVNTLFSEEKIVHNFSHMKDAFLTVPLSRGDGPVSPLPKGDDLELPDGAQAWITDRSVTALVVLQGGKLRHESYHLDTQADDLRISWSVAKSFLSALMGVLVEQGSVASLDDPVTKYAPSLIGGAYDGATIRNVLNMASGVTFNEDYLDSGSDINKMGRVLALGKSMDDFTAELTERFAQPGETWQYVSIDTHVIGMVIRGATGRTIPDLMNAYITGPMGFEMAPYYLSDGEGVAFVLGGLNLRTRDYARFGQMFLQKGEWQGQQVVPAQWIAASTVPSAPTEPGEQQYGYQWWIAPDAPKGEYFARGIYGQYIFIDTNRDVVVAVNAADRGFREQGAHEANIDMMRKIAAAAGS
ncbi:serine hydrolase domain-containing protein [Aliiroseovarius crassostreae]|uniref:serine hydrolase domain-containing protein n=1 Tax=Aliiroseovarius crassostreae TaxID=154981 RepID=UPI0022035510|nr:serine hydrolase [Aliiroseovarius crassostreae]UWP97886.1 beta-lactamase family protein [Aliiroseovarius crassostreae]